MDRKKLEEFEKSLKGLQAVKAFTTKGGSSMRLTKPRRHNPKKDRTARRPRPDWRQDDRVVSRYGTRIMTGHLATKFGYYKPASGETGPRTGGKNKAPLQDSQIGGYLHKLSLIHSRKGKNGRSFTADQLKRVERGASK